MTATARLDIWGGSKRAGFASLLVATIIDVAIVAVPGALAAAGFGLGLPALGWTGIVVAALLLIALVTVLAFTGRSPGRRALGLRTLARADALPTRNRIFAVRRTVDVRHGRDPATPLLDAFTFPAVDVAAPTAHSRRGALVELDSGERLLVADRLILGRGGVPDEGDDVFAWADISRSLSKHHARIEWDGTHAWVTDLGSTNSSFLETPAGPLLLIPFGRTQVTLPAMVRLGGRRLRITEADS